MPVTKSYNHTKLGKIRGLLKGASESLLTVEKNPALAGEDLHFAVAAKNVRMALEAIEEVRADVRSRQDGGK